jgi:hypothetical protein
MPIPDELGMWSFDFGLDVTRVSRSRYGAAHPTRLTRYRTFMRMASSRNLSRLAAKKRPNDRPFLSFSIRTCQLSAGTDCAMKSFNHE